MVLITGGYAQGQEEYAKTAYSSCFCLAQYHLLVREQLMKGLKPQEEAQKLIMQDRSSSYCDAKCDSGEHEDRDSKHKDKDSKQELVIVTQEIGGGVVPMEEEERRWREENGRVNCLFAAAAREVWILECGIPRRLK